MMTTLVTQKAPDFKAQAVMGDNQIKEVSLSDFDGQYKIIFFYPLDFTFVCPSEILAFNKKYNDFKERNCQLLGISVDSHFTHLAYKNTKLEDGGIGQIRYPLISDITKEISKNYGILFNQSIALRGLFLLDKENVIKHAVINDLSLGRSVDEALRMLDALQFVEKHGEVCPANWHKGDEGMKPTSEGVASYLSKNLK